MEAHEILQQSTAIGLALSGMTEEGASDGRTALRELEALAYDKHTERWERKKIALMKHG